MADAESVLIAKAVVTELNAGTFSQAFTAERNYDPEFALSDLATLRITVIPAAITRENDTRTTQQKTYPVEIGVQKKLAETDITAEMDALLYLVQEIMDHFADREHRCVDTVDIKAVCIGMECDPLYYPEHMIANHSFTSVVRLTYRVRN